jgi:hypothetical protein
MRQSVRLNNVFDRKEKLFVTYIITYNINGSTTQLENGTTIAKGAAKGDLAINI